MYVCSFRVTSVVLTMRGQRWTNTCGVFGTLHASMASSMKLNSCLGLPQSFLVKLVDRKGSEENSAGERMEIAVRALQQIYKSEFWNEFDPIEEYQYGDGFFTDDILAKASAWYYCAYPYSDESGYAPYLSFAWLASTPMCQLRARVYGEPR